MRQDKKKTKQETRNYRMKRIQREEIKQNTKWPEKMKVKENDSK